MKKMLVKASVVSTLLMASVVYAVCPSPNKVDGMYLVDDINGVVTDNVTGLMWARCTQGLTAPACAPGSVTTADWLGAFNAVKAANIAVLHGHSDWRLPNVKELASIVDKECSPTINATVFPATAGIAYWTSSPAKQMNDSAFMVNFSSGAVEADVKASNTHAVRLVRTAN